MSTLLEYFNNDFKDLGLDTTITFAISNTWSKWERYWLRLVEVKQSIRQHGDCSALASFDMIIAQYKKRDA